jgi:Rrf2 family protein
MANINLFSDAFFIAVHALSVIKKSNVLLSCKEIALKLNVSYDHLSKILQKLEREEILFSKRGPKGGFFLNKEKLKVSLFDILEIVDGKARIYDCPFNKNNCQFDICIIDNFLKIKTDEIVKYLKKSLLEKL